MYEFSVFTYFLIKTFKKYQHKFWKWKFSSDPPCTAMSDSQRYPCKLCLIKYELDINVYNFKSWLFSIVVFLHKSDFRISTAEKHVLIITIKHYSKITISFTFWTKMTFAFLLQKTGTELLQTLFKPRKGAFLLPLLIR